MKPNITPLGLIVAALIISILASLALPRLRESSRGEEASGSPRVLATFESAVPAGAGVVGSGVVVTCKSCDPVVLFPTAWDCSPSLRGLSSRSIP